MTIFCCVRDHKFKIQITTKDLYSYLSEKSPSQWTFSVNNEWSGRRKEMGSGDKKSTCWRGGLWLG